MSNDGCQPTHPEHPASVIEGKCNALRSNCGGIGEEGEKCDYHYQNSNETICPECGTPRQRCRMKPERGKCRCRYHGGSNNGLSVVKHGAVSENIPVRILAQYQHAINNPDILNMTNGLALLLAREDELLLRLKENDFGIGLWAKLKDLFIQFRASQKEAASGDMKAVKRSLKILGDIEHIIVKGHYYDELIWNELYRIQDEKRKTVALEMARRQKADEVITPEKFKDLLGYILNSVQVNVRNIEDKQAVVNDIRRLLLN